MLPARDKTTPSSNGISVFNYFNYRAYLLDYYRHRKSLNRLFSYRAFARKAGYNSSGLYLLLAQGKQNLTKALLPKFCNALGLSARECEYFELMVDFTHAKTPAAKQELFERMLSLLPSRTRNIGKEQKDYYGKWYHVALREGLSIVSVRDNYRDLGAFLDPPIRASEAKAGIRLLESLGLIRRDGSGCWRATDDALKSTTELGVVTIHGFQKAMMDMAKEALDRYDRKQRNISCSTFSISEQGMERLSRKMDQFLAEIVELVRSDEKVSQVYQFNLQLYPISRRAVE